MAIGEMMTVKDGDQLSPMGYGTFYKRWMEFEPELNLIRGREKVRSSSEKSIYRGIDSPDAVDLHAPAVSETRTRPFNDNHSVDESSHSSAKSSALEQEPANGFQGRGDGQYTQFREWFQPITSGIIHIAEARAKAKPAIGNNGIGNMSSGDVTPVPGDSRLRKLQHRLVDLIDILDARGERSEARRTKRTRPSPSCECSACRRYSPENTEQHYRVWNWNLHIRKDKNLATA